MELYYGSDDGDDSEVKPTSPGGIVMEAVSNIRTVASLTLERERTAAYEKALAQEDRHPIYSKLKKGTQKSGFVTGFA